jgi:hypothetical protein
MVDRFHPAPWSKLLPFIVRVPPIALLEGTRDEIVGAGITTCLYKSETNLTSGSALEL